MRPSVPAVVDETVLDSYRMLQEDGEPDVVTEFIDTFLEDMPSRIARIRAAVLAKVPGEIKSASHALKGAAAAVGAVRLAQVCGELEHKGRDAILNGIDELGAQVDREAAQAREILVSMRRP